LAHQLRTGARWPARDLSLTTVRPDRVEQAFTFLDRGKYLESVEEIPEPHEFQARVSLSHGGHRHDYDFTFVESHHHDHDIDDGHSRDMLPADGGLDAHALAHSNQINRRFASREVTTWQIVAFGLTGGLVPCPAAITVLLLCLQLKRLWLGVILVGFFSVGLAVTMVMVGVLASLGLHQARRRWSGLDTLADKAPYASAALMLAIAVYMGVSGWLGLPGAPGHP
jgi:nickel/cobalt transporter (NicO) family protein